jgi:uncharacterized protein YdeI (YjbR/CyaY-like superfamily)
MGSRDPRIDAYIAKSADFAQPILTYLRETVHQACPEVQEDMKWSSPHFMYHGMMCGMSAFKEHCAFGFWKGALIAPGSEHADQAMGQFGRVTRLADLPPKQKLVGYIKKAAQLNREGVKVERPKPKPRPKLPVPAELKRALQHNKAARITFEHFSPSHQREYIEWLSEAKSDATRERRLVSALEWMAEGKPRNWKYMK